jgi:STE24 endopeptidase
MSYLNSTLLLITTTLPALLTLYLLDRNSKTFTQPYPKLLANLQTEEEFKQAAVYATDKNKLAKIKEVFEHIKTCIGIYGGIAYFWKWTTMSSEIMHSIAFIALYTLFDNVTGLPLAIYSTFGIEEKHGFNKQTIHTFVTDMIKEFIMTITIVAPIVTAIIYAVHWAGDMFFVYIFAFL